MVFATMFLLFILQLDNSIFTNSTNNAVRFFISFFVFVYANVIPFIGYATLL